MRTWVVVTSGLLALGLAGGAGERRGRGEALSVNILPAPGTVTSANPTLQISGCDTFYGVEDAIITVNGNGVSYATQPPGSGNCATSFSRRFDVSAPGFVLGPNTVVATVFNANGDSETATATYTYNPQGVTVIGGSGVTVPPNANGSVAFVVTNTGVVNGTLDLSASCPPPLASCSIVGMDPLSLVVGQSATVVVNVTAGASEGTGDVTLAATFVTAPNTSASGTVSVTVRTPVDRVTITPSPVQVGVSQSTTLTGTAYDAANHVLPGRSFSWSVAHTGIATVSPSVGTTTSLFGQGEGGTTVTALSEGKSATANVTVGSVAGPTVTFVPASGTRFTSATQTLIVRGCHGTLPVTDAALELNDVSVSYTQTGTTQCGGGFGAEFHATVTLSDPQNTLEAVIHVNNGSASTTASATYYYDNYAIATLPDGGTGGSVVTGGTGSLTFSVTNTGNVAGTVVVSPSCTTGGFSCAVVGATSFALVPQEVRGVSVAYTAGQVTGPHAVGLTASFVSPGTGSDAGSYTVTVTAPPVVVANVDVALGTATITPGAQTTATATLFDAGGQPVTGQSVTWSSSAPGVATVTGTGALTATVSGVAVGQAWVRAVATNGVKDSALVTVQTSGGTPAVIAVNAAGLNAETQQDQALCLAAALGPGGDAASVCGALRVTHPLPAFTVRTTALAPALLYTSATAHPYPLVRADVRYTSGNRPDSVEAILRVNGVERRRGKWAGTSLVLNVARRLAIGYDAIPSGSGDSTGIYPYTLEVAAYNANVRGTPVTVSGELLVVNRSGSRFGPGWWLTGLEQLFVQGDGSLLWVGADGSARRYASAGANVWVAPPLVFPDTIRRSGTVYTRHAPGGVKVRFNGTGNHTATVRALGDSTRFVYGITGGTPRVDTIGALTPANRYGLAYNANGRLTAVVLTPLITPRTTAVAIGASGQVASLTDPDGRVVSFGYDPTFVRRLTSRTDRRGTTTTYSYDAGWLVRQATTPLDAPAAPIVTTITPAETRGLVATTGLSALADTASAYTLVDGPRTDVGDSVRFWLDLRYGAPRRITDALGFTTSIERTNASYPALVTRVQRPNGHVQRFVHDARGHVHLAIDSGGLVAGQQETTRYEWNNSFDQVERIVPQLGDSTVMSYDPASGNLLWTQDARGVASRVHFDYYPATDPVVAVRRLLVRIRYPGTPTPADSFAYDTHGNVASARTPLGFVTTILRDRYGRDTLTVSPITSNRTYQTRRLFDVMDRVTREATVGSGTINYGLPGSSLTRDTAALRNDTLVRIYSFDEESNPTGVSSYGTGGVSSVGTAETRTFDRAHRLLTTDAGSGPRGYTWDPAGNATALLYGTGQS
jgi:hypothetical protein